MVSKNKYLGGVVMNIIIDKNATDFIRNHSKDNAIILFTKHAGGG
jgi:hypothetical protein